MRWYLAQEASRLMRENPIVREDSWYEELGDDWDDDDLVDDEVDDDAVETLPCPHCGAEIYEETERCPVCGEYVTFRTSVWSGRPVWWIVLGLIGLVAAVLMLAGLAR